MAKGHKGLATEWPSGRKAKEDGARRQRLSGRKAKEDGGPAAEAKRQKGLRERIKPNKSDKLWQQNFTDAVIAAMSSRS